MAENPTDVVIIGSGIGGLSLGIILARCGYRVTIAEKNARPGGLMRGYVRQGIECDVGVHYIGAMEEGQILRRMFDFLGVTSAVPLTRMGRDGVVDRYHFDDRVFDMPPGLDAYQERLLSAFPDEERQILAVMERLKSAAAQLNSLDLLLGEDQAWADMEQFEPMGEYLRRLGCSPALRTVLGVPSCWIGVPLDDCPVFYHNMALSSYLLSAWRLRSGGIEMADAFAERFRELGGELITGDGVTAILAENRRKSPVSGVRLASGKEISAPVVVGALHPKVVIDLLPEKMPRPLFRKRINELENTHGILAVQVAVDAEAHPAIPHNIFRIHRDDDGNITDIRFYQIRNTRRPEKNLLSILTSGQSELWREWENTFTGRRGSAYIAAKTETARQLMRESETDLGPLNDPVLLDVYTPLSIRDWVSSPGGSAYGVLRSCDQLMSAAMLLHAGRGQGLYLAGQSMMAPGVLGTVMGSFMTAKMILGPAQYREKIVLKFQTN